MKLFVILAILSTSLFAAKDPVVATVNGKKIFKSTLDTYHTQNLTFVQNKNITKERSLNDLINKILGVEKAKKNKLDKDPDVRKKFEDILFHAQISKDLEGRLGKIKVSDSEVKSYYSNYPEYRTAQILFRLKVKPTSKEVEKAINDANTLYSQLKKKPESFLATANSISQSSSLTTGGDLGYQPNTRLSPDFFKAIKGKKKGSITKPFRTQYGIHLVKVLGVKTYKQIDKNMYKKIIYDQKRDAILKKYFKDMKSQAKVKINKEYLK
jgi:parvulin-like peptidyl-prolyl isomerase